MATAKKLTGFMAKQPNGLIKASTSPPSSNTGSGNNKFIASAIKHPGSLHRALNVPVGQKIPVAKIQAATKSSDADLAKKARFALTLEGIGK